MMDISTSQSAAQPFGAARTSAQEHDDGSSSPVEPKVRLAQPRATAIPARRAAPGGAPSGQIGSPTSEAGSAEGGVSPPLFGFRLGDDEREFLAASLADLTGREREVVVAICLGGTNEEIAQRLCIALPTLRTHLMRLNQKLGTASKTDVVGFVSGCLLTGYRAGQLQRTIQR